MRFRLAASLVLASTLAAGAQALAADKIKVGFVSISACRDVWRAHCPCATSASCRRAVVQGCSGPAAVPAQDFPC